MKRLQGNTIRNNEFNRNKLYSVPESRMISLEERQKDGTKDLVQLNFKLKEYEYGLYGNEYRPTFLDKNDCKSADILSLIVNEEKKEVTSYLYDVKRKADGEQHIYHFIGQLEDSYLYKKSMLLYLEGFKENQHLGVITADFNQNWMDNAVKMKKEKIQKDEISNIQPALAVKIGKELLNRKKELELLERFSNRQIEIDQTIFDLEVHIMQPKDSDYYINIDIQL